MTQGSLPPATAEGTLETSPLAQVMAHALDRKLAGSLQLDGPQGTIATVVMHDGWPYKARTAEAHYLGMVLHQQGIIDDTKLNASLARFAKERRPHGQILLEMGAMQPNDLMNGLRAQLTAKLEPLFGLPPSTYFRFYEKIDLLPGWGGPEVAPVDPLAILWPAIVRSPPWPQVKAVLARIQPEIPMRIQPRFELSRFRFAKKTGELVELMRMSPLTLEQMPSTQLVDAAEAQLLVYAMLLTKQMVFLPPEARRPSAAPAPMPPHAAAPTPMTIPKTPGVPQMPVPSVPPYQPPPEMRPIAPSSVFPPGAGMAPRSIPAPKIGSVPPPGRASGPPPKPSAPPPGVALTPELAAFRQRIIDRMATIDNEDFFEVLDIPRESSTATAQAAFLTLAKTWHPDRLAPQLFDVKDFSVKIFSRMNDARLTLTAPDLREAYIDQLRRGVRPGRSGPVEETNAVLEFQKAEFFLRKRQYASAEEHCRKARAADPANAEYLAMLTWIAMEKAGPAGVVDNIGDHIEAMTLALKLNERCERAFYCRGLLYKKVNRIDKAMQDFKSVVEVNPGNIDAARELRLYKKRST